MTIIGLRVYSNSKIYYCILEQDCSGNLNYIDISHINIPIALQWPEALNFVRHTVLDILLEYKIDKATIRICEFGATLNTSLIERNYVEGVLQEALASSNINKYLAGKIAEFKCLLGMKRDNFKKYATGELTFTSIPSSIDWNKLSLEERETILIANAVLNL